MPPATYDLAPFGREHFGRAELGHAKRTKSLADPANRVSRHPGGSLPEKLKGPNALRRCYDLMNTEAVTHAAVLSPHARRTAERLPGQAGVALCLHDTTELDFTGHTSLRGELGQIGDGSGRGYECHNSLVVLPQGRRVLGLLAQQLHVRGERPEKESYAQSRERQGRESLLWPRGVEATQRALATACEATGLHELPAGLMLVDVFDRGGDTFEMLDYLDRHQRRYVARSSRNRAITVGHGEEGEAGLLHGYLRTLPRQGSGRQVTVHGRDGQPDRQAAVVISWAAVRLEVPVQQRGHYRKHALLARAVRAWEPGPPAGVEAVEWSLLTNVPVASAEGARERVAWYCTRWVAEEYHQAQKTGRAIEAPQFETAAALQPMIALLSVVAVSLLNLREMSRDEQLQGLPAEEAVSREEVEVLSGWRHQEVRPLSVREFFLALARLGGHPNRRKDKRPGWLVLWRGWQALQLMVQGARAARAPRAAKAAGSWPGQNTSLDSS